MIIKSFEILKNTSKLNNVGIFILYGENIGLKKDLKKEIISINSKKEKGLEVLSYTEEEVLNSKENFYSSVYSGSLFGGKKILVIDRVSDKFFEYLKNNFTDKNPKDIIIILMAEILDKKSKLRKFCEDSTKIFCVPCYLDSIKDLQIILKKELENTEINMSQESINLLIENANGDRNNIKNEIEKIKTFAKDKGKITHEQIKELTNSNELFKAENLINVCLCGEKIKLKKILSDSYINLTNYILILKTLSRKIEKLIKIQEKRNQNQSLEILINNLKPPIFWKEKPILLKQLKMWKRENLVAIIQKLNKVELECKKNDKISLINFLNFLIMINKKASNFS